MCGGLNTALGYLDMAGKLERRSSEWISHIESAERILKWLAYKRGVIQLLAWVGRLPADRNLWRILSQMR